MNMMMCTRCGKRPAVVFTTRLENGKPVNERLCLKCAKELNIGPMDDLMKKLGLSEEDLDKASEQMMELMNGANGDFFEQGGAMPFPLMKMDGEEDAEAEEPEEKEEIRPAVPEEKSAAKAGRPPRRQKLKFLENFCENLNRRAADGKMDPVVGRQQEIERVIQILNRRTKNNPCLLGEPGVGKTAVAEGIAQRIVEGKVPLKLQDKEIYRLDLTGLIAGTQFRGQFESRIKGLLADIKTAGNVILFIDEVHTLVGAGDGGEGTMNAANILKPALSRGEVQVIGATTFNEYRKHIEKDSALERRFQTVKVGEPNIEQATEVLLVLKSYYEAYHRVSVSDEIARRAVVLSERYITDRFLPDKAIDLLDEACSCSALANKDLERYDRLYREKVELDKDIAESIDQPEVDYEALANKKAKDAQLQQELEQLAKTALNAPVTEDDLAKVLELWTGIPSKRITQSELKKAAHLEEALKKRIVGQDEAVRLVAAAVRRSRIQLTGQKRPASFIFVGPTGVGKTELVKVLSEQLFDSTEPLIRLDMSEYMEKHSVSRMIGSPPGYVGYDEAGQLTEKIRRRPYSVVLFDEIEKAHPDVMNILLQILDEGHITDAQGRDINFANTILVMTSNAGSDKRDNALGFNRQAYDAAKEKAEQGLREFLRPEFIARVDEIITFRPLGLEDFRQIAALMADELKPGLRERGIAFDCSPEALELVAKEAYGHKNGARDIRRELRRAVEDPLCMLLAESDVQPTMVKAVAEDGKVVLKTDLPES